MTWYFKVIFFIIAMMLLAFSPADLHAVNLEKFKQITTKEEAAKYAAKLANEKCQEEFGYSPFKPGSYKAELAGSKWHWGKIEPAGIHGYSAKVEFRKDGSGEDVRVVFHVDVIDSKYREEKKERGKNNLKE